MAAILQARRNDMRRQRIFRDRTCPLDIYDDQELIARYRLPRHLILELCGLLDDDIKRQTRRSMALPVALQVSMSVVFVCLKR